MKHSVTNNIRVATTQVMGIEYCEHPQSPFVPHLHAVSSPQVIHNFAIIFLIFFYSFTTCGLVLSFFFETDMNGIILYPIVKKIFMAESLFKRQGLSDYC